MVSLGDGQRVGSAVDLPCARVDDPADGAAVIDTTSADSSRTDVIDSGARSLRFDFPQVEGVPKELVFGKQVFALKKRIDCPPHGGVITAGLLAGQGAILLTVRFHDHSRVFGLPRLLARPLQRRIDDVLGSVHLADLLHDEPTVRGRVGLPVLQA
mgnify:CR=1 FL=1